MAKFVSGRLLIIGATALGCMVLSQVAWAGLVPFPTTNSGVSDTRAGIGLRFEFGDNAAEVVGSVRHTYTDTNDMVTGGLAELAMPFYSSRKLAPKIRVMGLAGSTSVQAQAGFGYDFANQSPLIGIGVQGPYVEGGVNYLFNHEFHPYVGANIFGSAPSHTTVTLPLPTA